MGVIYDIGLVHEVVHCQSPNALTQSTFDF